MELVRISIKDRLLTAECGCYEKDGGRTGCNFLIALLPILFWQIEGRGSNPRRESNVVIVGVDDDDGDDGDDDDDDDDDDGGEDVDGNEEYLFFDIVNWHRSKKHKSPLENS